MSHPRPFLPIKNQIVSSIQTSKWLKLPLLVDLDEMKALMSTLGDFDIFLISGIRPKGEGYLTREEFLDCYSAYIEALKHGRLPIDPRIRPYFSSVWTASSEALYAVLLENDRQLIRSDKPVIQLQNHQFNYSKTDSKFRSMIWGPDHISWGIQFSYPQRYQDESMDIKRVRDNQEFVNNALFRSLQLWVRQHTVATPFLVKGERRTVPIRLGKGSFAWINRHPQLAANGLQVAIPPYSQ